MMIRILVVILVSLASIIVGRFAVSGEAAVIAYCRYGYFSILLTTLLFCYCYYKAYHTSVRNKLQHLEWRSLALPTLLIIACMFFVGRGSEREFKTIMDEHILAATAQSIHRDRDLQAPLRVHYLNSVQTALFSSVDKRPPLFPLLVSLVHDGLGYHPENSVRLNFFVLTPLLFGALYILGRRIAGATGGTLLSGGIATIPLVSTASSGGGLEILNLLLIVLCLLLAMDYVKKPTSFGCGALCFCAILLANTRYESVLFILPVACVCMIVWFREKQVRIDWPLFVAPVLLISYLWQNQIFGVDSGYWQLEGKSSPFALEFISSNFERSLYFFFNFDRDLPNSWFLAFTGTFGIVGLVLILVRAFREGGSWTNFQYVLLAFFPGFILLYGLLLAYSWEFDHSIIQRLSLPLYLPLALAAIYHVQAVWKITRARYGFAFLAFAYVVFYAYPTTSVRAYELETSAKHDFWAAEKLLMENQIEKQSIIIADNVYFFNIYGYGAVHTKIANNRLERLAWYLDSVGAAPVYFFAPVIYDPVKVEYGHPMQTKLDPQILIELIDEQRISDMRKVQLYRIVGVDGVELESEAFETTGAYLQKLSTNFP